MRVRKRLEGLYVTWSLSPCCADEHALLYARGPRHARTWYHIAGRLAATQGHTGTCPFAGAKTTGLEWARPRVG